MRFYIKEARIEANLTQKQLAEQLGITDATLSGYETGAHDPKSNTLAKIAEICGTTVDYLLGVSRENRGRLSRWSKEALNLATEYDALDHHGRQVVRAVLDIETARVKEEAGAKVERVISLRRYSSPAAAGAPLYAESDYEDVDFPAEIVPDGTSYALGVSGQSMEPEIPDGCTVFVEKTESVNDGDIIIAWIAGDGSVCKRAVMDGDQVVRLESANRRFADIEGADLDGMRVYGKVLGYVMG